MAMGGDGTLSAVLDATAIDRHAAAIARDGFTVLEHVIEPDVVDALAADLLRLEQGYEVEPAGNSFEGDAHDPHLQPPRVREALRGDPGP